MNHGASKKVDFWLEEKSGFTVSKQQGSLNSSLDSEYLKQKLDFKNTKIKSVAEVLSHQVSGPVATMKGLVELISSLPADEVKEYLPLLYLAIDQMDKAVKDITAVAFEAAE